MRKITIVLLFLFFLLFTISMCTASITISRNAGSSQTVQIETETAGYVDNLSLSSEGTFSYSTIINDCSISREIYLDGETDINVVTSAKKFDGEVGIEIKANSGYLGQSVDVASSLVTDFLAQAEGFNYLIDFYIRNSKFGTGISLNGDGNGKMSGNFHYGSPLVGKASVSAEGSSQAKIETKTAGYVDKLSLSNKGNFTYQNIINDCSISREIYLDGETDINAVTSAKKFDGEVGIKIKANNGYLGQSVDVASSLATDFLAQAEGFNYLIDFYIKKSEFGTGMTLQGNGEGELSGGFHYGSPSLGTASVSAEGDGNFRMYGFAPYFNFGANIDTDNFYTDILANAEYGRLDYYREFEEYLNMTMEEY